MLEKKQLLPLGSKVTVCYASDGGTETVLVVVGHLSLRNRFTCHYDYVCVLYPDGMEGGVYYINHTDIVSVIFRADETDKEYIKWLERKFVEYKVYYENYDTAKRMDIDTMRNRVLHWKNKLDECNEKDRIRRFVHAVIIILGAGIAVLLTGSWWMGLCALVFAALGYLCK